MPVDPNLMPHLLLDYESDESSVSDGGMEIDPKEAIKGLS